MSEFHDAIPVDWIAPGETTVLDVAGYPVAIANVDGEFCAFQGFCPHQGTVLGGVPLTRRSLLTCPEHHSVFDVRTGQCVIPSDDGYTGTLTVYETRVVDDVVQVQL